MSLWDSETELPGDRIASHYTCPTSNTVQCCLNVFVGSWVYPLCISDEPCLHSDLHLSVHYVILSDFSKSEGGQCSLGSVRKM